MMKKVGVIQPCSYKEEDEMHQFLPPGYRFHPTDEELVAYYLTNKVRNCNFNAAAIAEVDLNKCEPWELPYWAKMGEKEWYFYSLRDRKYPTGLRTNRATESGYWKATGKDREVMMSTNSVLTGMKKTLVFYRGRAPKGEKTNWIMHEYRLEGHQCSSIFFNISKPGFNTNSKDEWVVCRVFRKSLAGRKIPMVTRTPKPTWINNNNSIINNNNNNNNNNGNNGEHYHGNEAIQAGPPPSLLSPLPITNTNFNMQLATSNGYMSTSNQLDFGGDTIKALVEQYSINTNITNLLSVELLGGQARTTLRNPLDSPHVNCMALPPLITTQAQSPNNATFHATSMPTICGGLDMNYQPECYSTL